jgi:hypothetical protein
MLGQRQAVEMTRHAMWLLLAVVVTTAAVLSFASLRDLAVLCGYPTTLFPVTVGAGAAARASPGWMAARPQPRLAWTLTFLLA